MSSVYQISKIKLRRGPEQDLPGKPISLDPPKFEPGLEDAEIAFTVDSGRLFIGHSPNQSQPNYKRTEFPFQNIEILTEASTSTLRQIFNFLRRDEGSGSFFKATLPPTEEGEWLDVRVERSLGTIQAFHISGEEVIASIEYYIVEQDEQGVIPLRTGTLRVLSETGGDDALLRDEALALRRLDLATPAALDGNQAFDNVAFRVTRGGTIGERYFRFMYTTLAMDNPVTLYFRIARPLNDTIQAFDYGSQNTNKLSDNLNLTIADVQDIVGKMVQGDNQIGIQVSYNRGQRNLDFRTVNETSRMVFGLDLNLRGDVSGKVSLDSDHDTFDLTVALQNTGVTAGRYINPTITVDSKGRVTAVTSGSAQAVDPDAVYGGTNLGSGGEVFASKSGRNLQFRSIVAGSGITVTESTNALTLTVPAPTIPPIPPFLNVISGSTTTSSVSDITFAGNAVSVAQTASGKVTVTINQPPPAPASTGSTGGSTGSSGTPLPDQGGKYGYLLSTDGANPFWAQPSGIRSVNADGYSGLALFTLSPDRTTLNMKSLQAGSGIQLDSVTGGIVISATGTSGGGTGGSYGSGIPSQTGQAGKVLGTDGTNTVWVDQAAGTGGSTATVGAHRYWRVMLNSFIGQGTVGKIAFFDAAGYRINRSQFSILRVSSEDATQTAASALESTTDSGSWLMASGDVMPFVDVSFQTAVEFGRVRVTSRLDGYATQHPISGTLYYSDDDSAYIPVMAMNLSNLRISSGVDANVFVKIK